MWSIAQFAFPLVFAPFVLGAAHSRQTTTPYVDLGYAQVIGYAYSAVENFRGIPYAQPPVGDLRLRPPRPLNKTLGVIYGTGIPRACPQSRMSITINPEVQQVVDALRAEYANITNATIPEPNTKSVIYTDGEDCLTVNVQRPVGTTAKSKLPVVFWMYGGGFESGASQSYDATNLIYTSMTEGQGIIYVAVNYRVGGFGFLGGREIWKDGASNLGLLDQRLALEWVADNIARFGGDPSKVTIWGESAGAVSTFNQMAMFNGNNYYKGKPLFRAAIMDSGSLAAAEPVYSSKAQSIYDEVVRAAGCEPFLDTLACIRRAPYDKFLAATQSVPSLMDYSSLALSYLPRPDGFVLTQSPDVLAQYGLFAAVPFIVGDQTDEGTLFAMVQSNISTTAQLVDYLSTYFYKSAPNGTVNSLVATYPDDPSQGSPFSTGLYNVLYPQFKRLSAILGDIGFTLTRRILLNKAFAVRPLVPTWSYMSSYFYGTSVLGTFHGADILVSYGLTPGYPTMSIQTYYLNFINHMDPNVGVQGLVNWPSWGYQKSCLFVQADGNTWITDDFRNISYAYLEKNIQHFRV